MPLRSRNWRADHQGWHPRISPDHFYCLILHFACCRDVQRVYVCVALFCKLRFVLRLAGLSEILT